jgi:hypothetical protein
MGVTLEIGTSRSGNLLLQALIEGKKSYFFLYFFQIFMSKKMFIDRLDNYKIDNLHIMTKERCKYNLEMKTCHLVLAKCSAGMLNSTKVNELTRVEFE